MQRFLRITEEAQFGVYNSGGSSIYIRLSGDNAFLPMTDPEWFSVMDGSGLGIPVIYGSATSSNTATLTTELTYSQAGFLLQWGLQRINTGQSTPWTTTDSPTTSHHARSILPGHSSIQPPSRQSGIWASSHRHLASHAQRINLSACLRSRW